MLDITQRSGSFATPDVPLTGGPRTQGNVCSAESLLPLAALNPKPVVTWRTTRTCNLNCVMCQYDARPRRYLSELNTAESLAMIRGLAAYRVPRLVFAGGEPLTRPDLPKLVAYAHEQGISTSLATNGTLLSRALAASLKRAGMGMVTILMEAIGRDVDRQRGCPGAFKASLEGYANSAAAGLQTEIRTPLTRWNFTSLAAILDFAERQRIEKIVFTHLVYTGRGIGPRDDLTHPEMRRALDFIMDRAEDCRRRGVPLTIATEENHVDGIYLYLRLAKRDPRRATGLHGELRMSSAAAQGAGVGVAGIDSTGDVHPDPFWSNYILGNVREKSFREIWEKSSDPLLRGLRDRLPLLKGRCANCCWKPACGGNLRVRAEEFYGDPWMPDPACYLTNEEISREVTEQSVVMEDDVLLSEQAA